MKTRFFFIVSTLFVLFQSTVFAQNIDFPEDKVKWKFRVEKTEKDVFVVAEVKIVKGWHINAIVLPKGTFGLNTNWTLAKNPNYKTVGNVIEPKPHVKHDDAADEDIAYHEGTVLFKQKIVLLSDKDFIIKGTYDYQTCNEVGCLPPYNTTFSLKVKPSLFATTAEGTLIDTASQKTDTTKKAGTSASATEKVEAGKPTKDSSKKEENRSMTALFFLSFISGLAALFTPCVFPMIPMTVSFFTKQSKSKAAGIRNALFYSLSIIVIYILLGTVVTAVFGAEALNNMSTNPTFNIVFFLILVVFAVSFMGAFEIRMPSSWVNKADQASDKGGMIGIFFMALALALVSFSCTGPIVGTLIVEAASKGGIAPIIGMLGFSLALALPFGLFAAFPGWLNTLPKSGGWLNTVKVVLGLLELALAFKFLSNADLALQAHYFERELFLAIWIGIFLVLALYLFGFIQLPHDSKIERLSVGRALFGTFVLAFVFYMIPGLWGAPLKLISAFPPPSNYSEAPGGFGGAAHVGTSSETTADMHLGPQNIQVFHDLDKAKAYALKVGKPLFVDFTGHNCVNCRKMEESVWGEPGIIDHLKEDVVIASLHVDERVDLPKAEQKTVELVPGKFKKLITTGDKWMYLQIKDYKISSQPYYVMLDAEGKQIANGAADYQHHSSPSVFKEWLEKGLALYKK
ncbi:MAG: cytochrome c biogenesis protein CcdA [Moraxellaceae bacterium]